MPPIQAAIFRRRCLQNRFLVRLLHAASGELTCPVQDAGFNTFDEAAIKIVQQAGAQLTVLRISALCSSFRGLHEARKIAESGRRLKGEFKVADAALFDVRCFRVVSRQPPTALDRYLRGVTGHVARPRRSIETRSLPALACRYPLDFAFDVAYPISSILHSSF